MPIETAGHPGSHRCEIPENASCRLPLLPTSSWYCHQYECPLDDNRNVQRETYPRNLPSDHRHCAPRSVPPISLPTSASFLRCRAEYGSLPWHPLLPGVEVPYSATPIFYRGAPPGFPSLPYS